MCLYANTRGVSLWDRADTKDRYIGLFNTEAFNPQWIDSSPPPALQSIKHPLDTKKATSKWTKLIFPKRSVFIFSVHRNHTGCGNEL